MSAFGEREVTELKIFNLKIDDSRHGVVPIMCAVSKRLVNDMLVCSSAYEALLENVQFIHNPANSYVSSRAVEGITADDPKSISSQEMTRETYPSEIYIQAVSKANEEEQLPEGRETRSTFIKMQREDDTLKKLWSLAEKQKNSVKIHNGILVHSEYICGENIDQVVLSQCKREEVLKMAHDVPLGGHLGEQKTRQRIKYSFYWPTIKQDVKRFCESCKICQLRKPITYRDRVPIQPLVRPEIPFEVWSVDCIGPLEPPSRRNHHFIICAVDLCTRWAEAIPVKEISAKTTCNVLLKIFTQTGFPKMICSDQGTNFTSKLSEMFLSVMGVSPRFSTPGHPESMGAVERWNRTLKDMLSKNVQEHGSDWDLHLPFLLFAYREIPHSTTGMSPFQLVYGRLPSGPISLLKEVWVGERNIPTTLSRSVEKYLEDLIEKLRKAHEIAAETAEATQNNYASYYNLRSREKQFKVGDKVLVLLPSSTHKLMKTWIGPATIIEITRPYSAKVELDDGGIRELHFNKLRPYIARVGQVGLIFDQDSDFGDLHYAPTDMAVSSMGDVTDHISSDCQELDDVQRLELLNTLGKFSSLFSSLPGLAKVKGHNLKLKPDFTPKKMHPYRIPIALQQEVDRQINELLHLKLIEPSESEWAHPIVCVSKRNGSIRLCVDYRHLNSFTIADAYPMQNAKDLLFEVGQANYITVLDLTKGYWQIPMAEEAKPYTAFVTHHGHYQFWDEERREYLSKSYGSGASETPGILSIIYRRCSSFLQNMGTAHETSVCSISNDSKGQHSPDPGKVESIKNISVPTTKKEIRSFLGLTSYYREYIPNFASLVLPLTELTKNRVPNIIPWNEVAEQAFTKLKAQLVKAPSLYTPDLSKPYQLYTDASATAIGACLSQNDEKGKENPIAFFSKKLTETQTRWATIEREAYAVIEALKRFDSSIFGAEIEVISYHNPLTYLTLTTPQSAKLTRWALALQRYNIAISYRKGVKHGNADALSRLPIPVS
ncbi:retrovirus-related Pol polyprotein from transposon opus [Trichonephila clavipes]|nr:retrovirus-related Pol polyprotein from transposon opus [Trichonephila clavipes]